MECNGGPTSPVYSKTVTYCRTERRKVTTKMLSKKKMQDTQKVLKNKDAADPAEKTER